MSDQKPETDACRRVRKAVIKALQRTTGQYPAEWLDLNLSVARQRFDEHVAPVVDSLAGDLDRLRELLHGYHLDSQCGSCGGLLECSRDALCEKCQLRDERDAAMRRVEAEKAAELKTELEAAAANWWLAGQERAEARRVPVEIWHDSDGYWLHVAAPGGKVAMFRSPECMWTRVTDCLAAVAREAAPAPTIDELRERAEAAARNSDYPADTPGAEMAAYIKAIQAERKEKR